jgi:hypothetical protein
VLITKGYSWLEHLTVNQRVPGSSPGLGAKSPPIGGFFFASNPMLTKVSINNRNSFQKSAAKLKFHNFVQKNANGEQISST